MYITEINYADIFLMSCNANTNKFFKYEYRHMENKILVDLLPNKSAYSFFFSKSSQKYYILPFYI